MLKIKNVLNILIIHVNMEVLHIAYVNLNYSMPKYIPLVFYNASNYDSDFIIKELAEECEGQFTCLEKNTEKYITFSIQIEKEFPRIDKKGKEVKITKFYRFIDSPRFMASSQPNLVNNLVEGIRK